MTNYEIVGLAEGFIEPESEEQLLEAWQLLYDRELYKSLQGSFGRTIAQLIKGGYIKVRKNNTKIKK